jgi:hypothetical protein
MAEYPAICRGIMALGSVTWNGRRPTKYLALYQAYEGLEPRPQRDLAALRHGLAHGPGVLTNPRTVERLGSLFGSVEIDLGDEEQQCMFWVLYADVLIGLDEALRSQIVRSLGDFQLPRH